jgi:hypothetical protein
MERDLHSMPLSWLYRDLTCRALISLRQAQYIAIVKDIAMRKEAIKAKWIQMAGKPNKDFLAKPKRERKRLGNMTIDNTKDKPDLPRMDDINLILQNFVEYYAK